MHSVTEKLRDQVRSVMERHVTEGEGVIWDVILDIAPSPNGPVPIVLLFTSIPSAILGQNHIRMTQLPFVLDEDAADTVVFKVLEDLRGDRSGSLMSKLQIPGS